MLKYAFAIAVAAALFFPISGYSQQIEFGPGGVRIDRDREGEGYRHRIGMGSVGNCGGHANIRMS